MNDVFEDIIYPANPRNEIVVGMSDKDYRKAPGISPSSIKQALPDLSGSGQPKGSAARLRAYLNGDIERKETKALQLGTLAHALTLEPSKCFILNEERRNEMTERRKQRKSIQLMEAYSSRKFMCNFEEAKAFKKEHGRVPEPDEQAELIKARVKRELEGSELSSKSSEMVALRDSGKLIVDDNQREHKTALAMNRAMKFDSMNTEVNNILQGITDTRKRVEVALFCVIDVTIVSNGHSILKIPIQLKGKPDLILQGDTLDDYKTCRSIDINDFSKESINRGYFLSMGVYNMMLNMLADRVPKEQADFYSLREKKKARLIAQETTAPYEAHLYEIPHSHLDAGRHFADMALKDICLRYLAAQRGEADAWKTCRDNILDDPLYPASISHFICDYASSGMEAS